MAPDLHTPLESLLLFQSLHPFEGINPPSFVKISDTLKNNELLRESDSFEEDRLEPESLRGLYLRLLKEEVKAQSERDQGSQKDGQSPRKRKRSSPLLETVDQALQYTHLLPQLMNRLYFKYRDDAIESIKDEERTYRSLQRKIQEIERGELEERSQQVTTLRRDSRGVSSIQTLLRHDDEGDKQPSRTQSRPTSSHGLANGGDVEAQTETSQPLPNGLAQEAQQLPFDQRQIQPLESAENNTPFLPPPQHLNQGYPIGSPSSDINRRLPPIQLQSHPAPSPSPRSAHNPQPQPERSSASPIILPPPPAMLLSSGSPAGPLDTLADMAGQQYRPNPAMQSPRPVQHPGPQQPRNYVQRPYPNYDNQSPYSVPYSPYGQGPLPPANYQYQGAPPPYQVPTASSSQGSPYGSLPPYPSSIPQYPPHHPAYNQSPGYYQQKPVHAPYARGQVARFSDQYTPIPSPPDRQRPPKPSPIITSASSTRWKDVDAPGSVQQHSPIRPQGTEISPISDRAPSPSLEAPHSRTKGDRGRKNQTSKTDSPSVSARGKPSRGRGATRRGRGGRAASVASSAQAESSRVRTRSQSVVSQADELSIDPPASSRKIKPEVHEDDTSIASHTADEDGRKSIRQRRGTIPALETHESNRQTVKRKRKGSVILPPPSPAPTQLSKPGYILGTRNFPRTSATLMNDIIAHKVGNLFAKPLTHREAPGYKDLIYRPQDLKSIKNAINAGSKALMSAAETVGDDGNSSNIWIPETSDVVPPKGIVNSAQLEKELMRMFANAIMFNPDVPSKRGVGPAFRTRQRTMERGAPNDEEEEQGEEEVIKGKQDVSVVKDTREMLDAVEKMVAEWRSAERAAEEGGAAKGPLGGLRGGGSEEADELAGNAEEIIGSVEHESTPEPRFKRRRR